MPDTMINMSISGNIMPGFDGIDEDSEGVMNSKRDQLDEQNKRKRMWETSKWKRLAVTRVSNREWICIQY